MLVTGVGPVNAACALARRLAAGGITRVLSCGIGGAYPGSGLAVGDVACAATEEYGDLGVETDDAFLTLPALGFPLVPEAPDDAARFELALRPLDRAVAFVTCSTCTGTDARAQELVARTGGAVESMEGAAIVHVGARFGLPVGEVRGISNLVGKRDRDAWRIPEAIEAAEEALLAWLG